MSEREEDFATMFEASVKARRFEQGQTIEGTIVAFGPEVAFVSIGGKSEAQIDLAELKDDDGDVEVSVGDRIQAVVVSTSGGITLSRKGVRNAATQRELENAFRAELAVEGKVDERDQGRLRGARRARACLLSALADRHRPHRRPRGPRRQDLHLPHHRVQGRRQVDRRLAAETARRGTAGERGRRAQVDRAWGRAARPGGVGARLRRLRRPGRRHPGPAARLRNELVARHHAGRDRHRRRSDHRQGAARRRGDRQDFTRAEAAAGRSVEHRGGGLRGGPGAERPRDAGGGVRRVRRTGAWHRRAGPRLDLSAHRPARWLGQDSPGRHHRSVRDPQRRPGAEAHRRRAGRRGLVPGGWRRGAAGYPRGRAAS